MDEVLYDGWGVFDEADPDDRVGIYRGRLYIDGIHISPWDCPDCLKRDVGRCSQCSFFDPVSCRLRYDPQLRCDLKSILAEYRDRLLARRARQQRFVKALRAELSAHGRPLHYTVLARIIADRYPALRATESKVLKVLMRFPEVFERVDEGVYQVRTA